MSLLLLTALGLPGFTASAATVLTDGEPPVVRITQVDTSQFPKVKVYISVTDASGEPVEISPAQLILMENGEEIKPEEIEGMSDAEGPLTTLLVMDVSGSMNAAGKLAAAQSAARAYVNQTRPNDLTGLLIFNTKINYAQPITQDRQAVIQAIDGLKARDDTAMYDALVEGIQILEGLPGRKAIIALTDGMDNQSTYTPKKVIDRISPAGLSISTIGLGDPNYSRGDLAGLDEPALTYLAEKAGGVYGYANDETALKDIYERYGRALQSEYALTYTSPATLRDGVNRSLSVSLAESVTGEQGIGATFEGDYNPGGLVPEVASPASWWIFLALIAGLLMLLVVPFVVSRFFSPGEKRSQTAGMFAKRVKLAPERKNKPNIKLKT